MTPNTYRELIDALSKAQSLEDVHAACSTLAEELEFDFFVYGARLPTSFVKPTSVIVSGYPDDWASWYDAGRYERIDPVITHCCNNITPLEWNTSDGYLHQSKIVKDFMGGARDLGLVSGVCVPLHGCYGEKVLLSLASGREPHQIQKNITRAAPYAQSLLAYVHEAIRRVLDQPDILLDNIQLTAREKECLLWTAEGKTAWEVSQILNIAERTVVFHLKNAAEKLGVTNRPQAIARAIALGMITPQPA